MADADAEEAARAKDADAEAEAEAEAEVEAPATSPLVGSIAAARVLGAHEAQWSRPPRRLCTLWPQVSAASLPLDCVNLDDAQCDDVDVV